MAIYTKTGDKGTTGTFLGKRISKSSNLINTIGAIDELNAYLGIIGGLTEIQKNLFTINSILSGAKLKLPEDSVRKLEREIDRMEGILPVQKNFIIYSGAKKARELFFARAICRRAERELVKLTPSSNILEYINRLSDFLFIKAREINFKKNIKEEAWRG